jgi:hypothetical protein
MIFKIFSLIFNKWLYPLFNCVYINKLNLLIQLESGKNNNIFFIYFSIKSVNLPDFNGLI